MNAVCLGMLKKERAAIGSKFAFFPDFQYSSNKLFFLRRRRQRGNIGE
jgi:hypothetical protein